MSGDVVLVTGGSGFLGQHVIKHLQEQADHVGEIRILDVEPFQKKLDYEDKKPVIPLIGSITDEDILRKATKGVNCVMHLAAVVSVKTFPDTALMEEVNIRGTQMLIQACIMQNVDLLIHCSTMDVVIGYNNIINGTEATVDYPNQHLFDSYAVTKCQGEMAVLKANGETLSNGNHLQTLTLRPVLMYGELDPYFMTRLIKTTARSGGKLTKFGSSQSYAQFVYVGNVAWSFICAHKALRSDPDLGGEAFFITDNTPTENFFNFSKPFLEANGFCLSSRSIPYWLIYFLIFFLNFVAWIISPIKQIDMPTTLSSVIFMNMKISFSSKEAHKVINYKPLFEPDQSHNLSMLFYGNYLKGDQ
ncbi:hypothetical protein KUTeg_002918 [Tegillarca granosa]|uniref:3-beta hydroxysteroid dehydrogenase/isomerase domain-containing protein n=1 Tax=Tegillarca granosa TaxID=220873 RepID=A0ABQ9FS20_TEGGR|nr:hypothetical protein KUTeg_010252 [Tegillarca granosa]KAJ8319531.1 hypothetical protein KUTeg_002918 [Tegillarca granosa]